MGGKQLIPDPPEGTGPSGLALWRSVLGGFEMEEHELVLLVEAVRTVDQLDKLAAVVAADGPMISENRIHPGLVESRQLRLQLARVLAALRLPTGDDQGEVPATNRRPQRRQGVRGVYGIRGA